MESTSKYLVLHQSRNGKRLSPIYWQNDGLMFFNTYDFAKEAAEDADSVATVQHRHKGLKTLILKVTEIQNINEETE